jgi:hypothetical protein
MSLRQLGIILAMMFFVVVAVIIDRWMQDKLWMILVLDIFYGLFLYLLIDVVTISLHRRVSLTKRMVSAIVVYTFVIAIVLYILAATTLELFELLIVRLNVVFLPILSLIIFYRFFNRRWR